MSEPSLWHLTGTIRHLDASRARQLVEAFQQPVVHDGHGITYDADDPVVTGTYGCLRLAAAASHDGSANVVGHYQTHLYLHEVLRLPLSVAREVARHRGHLYLDKLTAITGRAAGHLARHPGKLHLHGLTALSNEVADAFGRRTGFLCLRELKRLTAAQAALLAGHRGPLHLSALDVDDAVADYLGRHHGSLMIRVPAELPLTRLESLVRHQGPLEIAGLTSLDERQARVLAAQAGPRGIRGLSCLFIDTLSSMTPAVASILATHTAGGLFLTGATELSEDVAMELVKHPLLSLDRLERVSDGVATILATHSEVTLSLRGLADASPLALARLEATPSVELRRRPDSHPAKPAAGIVEALGRVRSLKPVAPTRTPLLQQFIRRIAIQGEAALKRSVHPTGESTLRKQTIPTATIRFRRCRMARSRNAGGSWRGGATPSRGISGIG